MILEYKFELDDAVAFNLHYMKFSEYGRKSLRRALSAITIIVFSLAYWLGAGQSISQWLIISSICSVALSFVYYSTRSIWIQRAIIAVHEKPTSGPPFGDRRMVMEATGIREISERSETFSTYATIAEPVETPSHVFIQINPLLGFVIPKMKVRSGSLADFLNLLREKAEKSRSVASNSSI